MIVFIAMVLVAGIAASVLIQTANKLEIQAMTTGQQTTNEVSTGIGIENIAGEKGNLTIHGHLYTNRIMNMTIAVSPRAGSSSIDLSKTVIELSNSTAKVILTYDSGNYKYNPAVGGVFATQAFGLTANHFGVIRIEDADNSASIAASPVINRGDHVMLTISTGMSLCGLTERMDVWGRIIPEQGAPGIFAFRTPASFPATVFGLY
jgi:flagellin FlaB